MSKDLEDFLRQAAELRQRKLAERRAATEQQEQQNRPRPRPYTNARQERDSDSAADYYDEREADILDERDLEMIDAVHLVDGDQDNRSSAAAPSGAPTGSAMPEAKIVDPRHGGAQESKPNSADLLREMLRQPYGLRQAFLVREILDRPRY